MQGFGASGQSVSVGINSRKSRVLVWTQNIVALIIRTPTNRTANFYKQPYNLRSHACELWLKSLDSDPPQVRPSEESQGPEMMTSSQKMIAERNGSYSRKQAVGARNLARCHAVASLSRFWHRRMLNYQTFWPLMRYRTMPKVGC